MAFTEEQIAEIESIVRSVIDTDGMAVDDDEEVPEVDADDIDDTYSFPLLVTTSGTPTGYGKVKMGGLIDRVKSDVETEGWLYGVTDDDLDRIFNGNNVQS